MERASKKIKRTVFIVIVVIAVIFLLPGACTFVDDIPSDAPTGPKLPTITKTGPLSPSAWSNILAEIDAGESDIILDLADCTAYDPIGGPPMESGLYIYKTTPGDFYNNRPFFAPGPKASGMEKIVELILPDIAFDVYPSFTNFTKLKKVSGKGLYYVEPETFKNCRALTTVDFPNVVIIDDGAFQGCISLQNPTFELLQWIGSYAFSGCTSLTKISFPSAQRVFTESFGDCSNLSDVRFARLPEMWNDSFTRCYKLKNLDFPALKVIGWGCFKDCTALETASFPQLRETAAAVFSGCTSLKNVDLSNIEVIGWETFEYTGSTELTIILGAKSPTLRRYIFKGVTSKKVNVKVPGGYDPSNYSYYHLGTYSATSSNKTEEEWGNGLRGAGFFSLPGPDTAKPLIGSGFMTQEPDGTVIQGIVDDIEQGITVTISLK